MSAVSDPQPDGMQRNIFAKLMVMYPVPEATLYHSKLAKNILFDKTLWLWMLLGWAFDVLHPPSGSICFLQEPQLENAVKQLSSNLVMFSSLCHLPWDVMLFLIYYFGQAWDAISAVSTWLPSSTSYYPTGQGPEVRVPLIAKGISHKYILMDWGNNHQVNSWIQWTHYNSDFRKHVDASDLQVLVSLETFALFTISRALIYLSPLDCHSDLAIRYNKGDNPS